MSMLGRVLFVAAILVPLLLSASAIPLSDKGEWQPRSTLSHRKKFYVDGQNIPGIAPDVRIGRSYAGLLPVKAGDPSRELWFWLVEKESKNKPQSHHDEHKDDLIIWMNGGPGCSSLAGAFGENGPFMLEVIDKHNTTKAFVNPYSWHHLANILYVEAPIGVGMTRGKSLIKNEYQFAKELYGFYRSFLDVFPEYKKKRVWIFGESYGAFYSVYSSSHFLDAGVDVLGIGIVDGAIASDAWNVVCQLPFAERAQKEMMLSDVTIQSLRNTTEQQGVGPGFVQSWLQKPLSGPIVFPHGFNSDWNAADLDAPDGVVYEAALAMNPCWNRYHITDRCPQFNLPLDPYPLLDGYGDPQAKDKFGSVAFRKHFNMPLHADWQFCKDAVFVGGPNQDADLTPALSDTPFFGCSIDKVIRHGNGKGKVLIMQGGLDQIVTYEATQLSIANTTWQELQGFQQPQSKHFAPLRVKGKGITGTHHTERGLTLAYAPGAGHEFPRYRPKTAFKLVEFLLGKISEEDLSRE